MEREGLASGQATEVSNRLLHAKDSPCPLAQDSRRLEILHTHPDVRRLLQFPFQAATEKKQ